MFCCDKLSRVYLCFVLVISLALGCSFEFIESDRDTNSDSDARAKIHSKLNVNGGKLLASDGMYRDFFGASVRMSGDVVIVGTQEVNENAEDSGSAYIFERDHGGADNWGQVKKVVASNGGTAFG